MPVSAATGNVFQVKVVGQIEGQITNNILYFASNSGDTDVEVHLILVLAACFVTHLLPELSADFSLTELRWKMVYPSLGVEQITVPPGTLQGGGNTSVPSFCSVVTSIKTATGGRRHRGRFYLAGVPEASVAGSVIGTGTAFWTAYLAFLACIVTNFVAGDPPASDSWQMMVYSRAIGGAHFPASTGSAFTPMTSLAPNRQLGTTRSRKIGHGT